MQSRRMARGSLPLTDVRPNTLRDQTVPNTLHGFTDPGAARARSTRASARRVAGSVPRALSVARLVIYAVVVAVLLLLLLSTLNSVP